MTSDSDPNAIAATNPIPRTTHWALDNLGNWSGGSPAEDPNSVVRTGDFNNNGQPDDVARILHHQVNAANEITGLYEHDANTPVPAPTAYIYDPAGNLVYDGVYYYQFDAWNRLLQLNNLGSATVGADGRLSGSPGAFVCRYVYDGLGRLMRKETPVSTATTGLQKKDLYYDGVRRIEEIIARPLAPGETVPGEGGPLEGGGGSPMGNDERPMRSEGGGPEIPPEPPQPTDPEPVYVVWKDRQYVYGPSYVDEFAFQIDKDGNVVYMLQDANYNVVALVSGGWGGSGTAPAGFPDAGTPIEQYTYEPYGAVIFAENLDIDPATGKSRHAVNRVGFQGLFFERYDGNYTDPTIAPGVAGLYHARNRFYSPVLGRFIQRDVNETAMPIITAMAMNGDAIEILLRGFNGQELYGDGLNLYQYAGSNPINRHDPSGLEFSLPGMAASMGIQGLAAGILNAAITKAMGGDVWTAFASGFVCGALGGGAGYCANAFAASLSGLVGTLATHMFVGGADGFVGAFSQSYYANSGDIGVAFADGLFGAAVGAATGGLMDGYFGTGIFGLLKCAAKYGIKPYKELTTLTAKTGLFAHHLIPQRFAPLFNQKVRDMLCIALTKEEHDVFTNAWRDAIEYGAKGTGTATKQLVEDWARKIYANYPPILRALGL